MKAWMFAGLALGLVACSSAEEVSAELKTSQTSSHGGSQGNTRNSATVTETKTDTDKAAAVEFKDDQKDGEAARDFSYSWPAEASAIAGLSRTLEARRDEALAKQKSEWEQSVAEFGNGVNRGASEMTCITCINRSYTMSWKVAAQTPRFLILMGERYTYTGGAHGNSVFETVMWDRKAKDGEGKAMLPIDLFVDAVALENTAYGEYCGALNLVRSERRGLNADKVNPFEDCPSVMDLVVTFGSSDGNRFDGIYFHAAPYVAGSFAEGPYEFAIAVSPAIIEAVKPEYRDVFTIGAG